MQKTQLPKKLKKKSSNYDVHSIPFNNSLQKNTRYISFSFSAHGPRPEADAACHYGAQTSKFERPWSRLD